MLIFLPACTPTLLGPTPDWEGTDVGFTTGLAWGDPSGSGTKVLITSAGNDQRPGPLMVQDPFGQQVAQQSSAEQSFGHLAVGDVDGDGFDDVVVARYLDADGVSANGGADLYLGGRDGLAKEPAWSWTQEGTYVFDVALGDLDLDGDLDLALATGTTRNAEPTPDMMFTNLGSTFSPDPTWTSDHAVHSFAVHLVDADDDGDQDGDLEVITGEWYGPVRIFGTDNGVVGDDIWVSDDDFVAEHIAWHDANGDGVPDLALSDYTEDKGSRIFLK